MFLYVSEFLCACVCVCVAVNSHACYRSIVNNITDCNSFLFPVPVFFSSILVLCV